MRMQPDDRRRMIVVAAIRVANSNGVAGVNHGSVAKRCAAVTSASTVRHYFPLQRDLWFAVGEDAGEGTALRTEVEALGVVFDA